jgi:PAS domain S-box-containing protein
LSFYTPATRGLIEAAFAEALECGTPYDLELEIITAQGDSRWVRTTGEPVYEDGTIVKLVGTFQDITERREVQVALTASEEKYRLLFETLQEGVAYCEMVYDADGAPIDWRYIEVNRAYGQLTGFERIESKLASDAIPGIREANPEELGILDKVARERTPAQFDEHLPLLPNPRWLRVSATSPSEGRFVVTLADITDRKAAEEALAASELRYRTLFESLVEGVAYCEMIFDDDATPIDWVYLDVNASFPRITGLADVKGKRVVEAIPGIRESNPELFDIYGRVAQTGVPATFESYVPMLRGGVWFEVSVTRPSENRFVAAFADITERKNAAVALQESERRYRELVEQTPDGIFLADSDGHYIDVNPAGAELLGYSSDEIRHVLFTDVLDASEFHRLPGAIEHMAGGETLRSEWLFKRKDGSTFIGELVGRMLPDGKLQGILRDVTVRKNAEEAIRNLNVTLENRVEQRTAEVTAANTELEAFAYAVSHDLRAPLRAMSGFSQALVEDCADGLDAQGRDYLQHIIAASRSMGDLIDALLLLSRATRGEMHREPVNVSGLASALLDERRTVNPERVVESEVEPGLMVFGDPRMIDSLMRNLIGNAWKYSRNEPVAHITVASTDIDGQSWICVTDDGAGFDPAYSDQLFKPFRRLHRQDEFNGIGIGLATVQRIVARHGGEIRADGEVGKGASFCFRLSAPTQPSQDDPEMPGHA